MILSGKSLNYFMLTYKPKTEGFSKFRRNIIFEGILWN